MTYISQGKPATRSKTIILATVTALLAALNSATETITDPDILSYVVGAVGLLNLFLRFYTKDPILPPGAPK